MPTPQAWSPTRAPMAKRPSLGGRCGVDRDDFGRRRAEFQKGDLFREQVRVSTRIPETTFLQHEDRIAVSDERQAMRNDDNRLFTPQTADNLDDRSFGRRIQ